MFCCLFTFEYSTIGMHKYYCLNNPAIWNNLIIYYWDLIKHPYFFTLFDEMPKRESTLHSSGSLMHLYLFAGAICNLHLIGLLRQATKLSFAYWYYNRECQVRDVDIWQVNGLTKTLTLTSDMAPSQQKPNRTRRVVCEPNDRQREDRMVILCQIFQHCTESRCHYFCTVFECPIISGTIKLTFVAVHCLV